MKSKLGQELETPSELSKLLESYENKDTNEEFKFLSNSVKRKKMIDRYQERDIYLDVHPYEETAIWLG